MKNFITLLTFAAFMFPVAAVAQQNADSYNCFEIVNKEEAEDNFFINNFSDEKYSYTLYGIDRKTKERVTLAQGTIPPHSSEEAETEFSGGKLDHFTNFFLCNSPDNQYSYDSYSRKTSIIASVYDITDEPQFTIFSEDKNAVLCIGSQNIEKISADFIKGFLSVYTTDAYNNPDPKKNKPLEKIEIRQNGNNSILAYDYTASKLLIEAMLQAGKEAVLVVKFGTTSTRTINIKQQTIEQIALFAKSKGIKFKQPK